MTCCSDYTSIATNFDTRIDANYTEKRSSPCIFYHYDFIEVFNLNHLGLPSKMREVTHFIMTRWKQGVHEIIIVIIAVIIITTTTTTTAQAVSS